MLTNRLPIRLARALSEFAARACRAHSLQLATSVALVMLLSIGLGGAQNSPDRNPKGDRAPAAQGRQPKQGGPAQRRSAANPAAKQEFIQRLSSLPEDQQEKMLKNSPAFQSLPTQQQERILRAARQWNAAGRPPGALQDLIEHQHPPGFFEQFREMSPEEQEKVMQNDARFQALPPERQQQIRENLNRWNAASPEQRQLLMQREQIVQSLSPEQRDQLRQIFPRYRELTPERRQAVMQTFMKLRDLPAGEREKFLSSPEVQQMSPEERGILGDLKSLLPAK